MPCTLPSHTALFTGLSPRASGALNNFARVQLSVETLAERLLAEGFATAAFFNQFPFGPANLVQGFQSFENDVTERAERVADSLRAWLAQPRERERFFAWVHLYIPHGPLDVPAEWEGRFVRHAYAGPLRDDFDTLQSIRVGEIPWSEEFAANYRDRYDAAVAFTDAKVGEIRAALEGARLLERTLLVCVADHGESLERGVLGIHSPVLRDVTLRVPLLLRGPSIRRGLRVDALVQHMDLFPTMLGLLGLAIPGGGEGRDLRPLLEGLTGEAFESEAVALQPLEFEGKDESGLDPQQAALVRGRFKLVLKEGGVRELYDLEADPEETRDLAAERPEVVRALGAAFAAWEERTTLAPAGPAVDERIRAELRKLGYQ
jgi:arylsulfatase A-like enzyme